MTYDDAFDHVLAVIERHLSGQLTFDNAIEAMTPSLLVMAAEQARLWRELERKPGDPIRLASLSEWRPHVPPKTHGPLRFAPGRSPDDEAKAQSLFEEACRRVRRTDL